MATVKKKIALNLHGVRRKGKLLAYASFKFSAVVSLLKKIFILL